MAEQYVPSAPAAIAAARSMGSACETGSSHEPSSNEERGEETLSGKSGTITGKAAAPTAAKASRV